MPRPIVVNVSGKAGAGKDTFSGFLVTALSDLGHSAQVVHFATALKRVCREKHGWNCEKDEAGRALLQRVGVEERQKWENIWTTLAERQFGPVDFVILADTRFKNEITRFQGHKQVTVKLVRLDAYWHEQEGLTGDLAAHISENELNDWPFDYVLSIPTGYAHLLAEAKKFARVLDKMVYQEVESK